MEGRRSNRLVRWGFTILLVLTSVYIFYLYRDVKALLHEREERLEGMISVRTKMVEELNVLIQDHTKLQEDLSDERAAHQVTRRDKESLGKNCENDLKNLKEKSDNEKLLLTNERDNYKQAAAGESENNRHLNEQQTQLTQRYNRDMLSCTQEKQKLRDDCQQVESQSRAEVTRLEQMLLEAQNSLQEWQATSSQCSSEVKGVKQNLNMEYQRTNSLQLDLTTCQEQLNKLHSQPANSQQGMHQGLNRQPSPQDANSPKPWDTRDHLREGKALENKLQDLRGHVDSFDFNKHQNYPRMGVQTSQNEHKLPDQLPRQVGGIPPNRYGNQLNALHQQPGWQQSPNQMGRFDMEGGWREGGMGIKTEANTPEKQHLPQQAEQEEVKVLELEEQVQVENEDDNGMDEQAFDPEKEEEKELDLKDGEQNAEEEKRDENFNLPPPDAKEGDDPKQQMPNPAHVQTEDGDVQYGDENRAVQDFPDQNYDDKEMKDDANKEGNMEIMDDDRYGDQQFQMDLKFDQQQRRGRQAEKREGVEEDGVKQGLSEWNRRRREMAAKNMRQQNDVEKQRDQQQPRQDTLRDNLR